MSAFPSSDLATNLKDLDLEANTKPLQRLLSDMTLIRRPRTNYLSQNLLRVGRTPTLQLVLFYGAPMLQQQGMDLPKT
jgi:hypothetical protein